MTKENLLLKLVLFLVGSIGIISTFTADFAVPVQVEQFFATISPNLSGAWAVRLLQLLMILIAVNIGAYFYKKAAIELPFFEAIVRGKVIYRDPVFLLTATAVGGISASILVYIIIQLFFFYDASELLLIEEVVGKLKTRLFFRAFTEEVISHFGLLSLMVWVFSKVKILGDWSHWGAIGLVSFLIAYGQSIIILDKILHIDSTTIFFLFFLIKFVVSFIFGWFYWKYGLGVSIISHVLMAIFLVIFL